MLGNLYGALYELTLLPGSAIPEGPTAYVLTREEGDYWVWNASTGEHFSFRDNFCPVQSVGCLVNADNVSSHWSMSEARVLDATVTLWYIHC